MGGSMWCSECESFVVHLIIHCRHEHPKRFHKMTERKQGKKLKIKSYKMNYVENCMCPKCKDKTERLLK